MQDSTTLFSFFAIVLAVVLVPGMDMAFVFASAINGGRRSGLSAVAGIICGGFIHLAAAMAGLAALLGASPAAFTAMIWIGMAYVIWIGLQLLRSGATMPHDLALGGSTWLVFRRGMTTSLLNPKAYLFMVAILPQFIRPDSAMATQAIVLGTIICVTQAGVYGALAIGGARFRDALAQRPDALRVIGRAMGVLLIAIALLSLMRT